MNYFLIETSNNSAQQTLYITETVVTHAQVLRQTVPAATEVLSGISAEDNHLFCSKSLSRQNTFFTVNHWTDKLTTEVQLTIYYIH